MSRVVKRVALDFDWPIDKVWHGFLNPYRLPECPWCDGLGWSELGNRVRHDRDGGQEWYATAVARYGHKALRCEHCDEDGVYSGVDPCLRALHDQWEHLEPPTGDGWQFWETVSEGSPQSPIFATREGLRDWLVSVKGYSFDGAEAFTKAGSSFGSFVSVGGNIIDGVEAVALLSHRAETPEGTG